MVAEVTSGHSPQCGENTRALCMFCKERGLFNLKKTTCGGKQLIKNQNEGGGYRRFAWQQYLLSPSYN